MPSKSEQQRRKKILPELKRQQQIEAEAEMPLSKVQLKALFDWMDKKSVSEGCNHSLRHAKSFLQTQDLSVEKIVLWLQDCGGFCECKVIANVEDVWVGSVR